MHEIYENPLCRRYAGREMQEIFSDKRKFSTWKHRTEHRCACFPLAMDSNRQRSWVNVASSRPSPIAARLIASLMPYRKHVVF